MKSGWVDSRLGPDREHRRGLPAAINCDETMDVRGTRNIGPGQALVVFIRRQQ
jgi:hypothetical protein